MQSRTHTRPNLYSFVSALDVRARRHPVAESELSVAQLRPFIHFASCALATVLSFPAVRASVISAHGDNNDLYTLLVGPTALALLYYKSKIATGIFRQPTFIHLLTLPLILFVLAIVQRSWPETYTLSLGMLALALSWLLITVLCYGFRAFTILLFPLTFMFLMVPLPSTVVRSLVHLLQVASLYVTSTLFSLAGVPTIQSGTVITLPGVAIEVAEECSGLHSSIIFFLTALVLANLFLESTGRKALLILFTIPLIALKNGLRIFTLAVLANYVDPSFLHGYLHRFGGSIFFVLALGVVGLILFALIYTEPKHPSTRLLGRVKKDRDSRNDGCGDPSSIVDIP